MALHLEVDLAMTIEVEIKIELEDPSGLEEAILDSGGELLKCEAQEDLYLDHPQYSFADTDEALRIRKTIAKTLSGKEITRSSPRYELTYKGPKIDPRTKTRKELSVGVDSGDTIQSILESIGFTEVATVRKVRTYFDINTISLVIDSVEGLGWFLEIEKLVENEDQIKVGRNELFQILDTLLSGEYESIRKSYLELLLAR